MPATGFGITLPGRTRFPTHYKLPVSGCLFWAFAGESLDQTVSNGVKGGQNATAIGDPSISDEYVSVSGDFGSSHDYLQLPFTDLEAMTYIVVARSTDTNADNDHRPSFIGALDGTDNVSGIYVSAATGVRLDVGADEGGGVTRATSVVTNTPTDWRCYVAAFDTDDRLLRDMTGGTEDLDAFTPGTTRALSATRINVGGGVDALRKGTADILHFSVWNRKLSSDEYTTAIYEGILQPWATAGGITI